MVFQCDYIDENVLAIRKEPIKINLAEYKGLAVSKSAIHEKTLTRTVIDEETGKETQAERLVKGVYVLNGKQLVFKEIDIIFSADDYVICSVNPDKSRLFSDGTIKEYDEKAAWVVMKALFASGVAMSIAGSSRPASGGEHKFAHMLEKIAPGKVLHGEACGIGTILSMYFHGGDWKRIRDSLKMIGAPTTPKDLGLSDAEVVEAVVRAKEIRRERYTIFDSITEEQAEAAVAAL